jgi:hypothetical protein
VSDNTSIYYAPLTYGHFVLAASPPAFLLHRLRLASLAEGVFAPQKKAGSDEASLAFFCYLFRLRLN